MAPKASSADKEKATTAAEEDEVLQAVILADSFNKRFKPLTSNRPRCLLPICNAPLLDWTFESLALAGVLEIFVICRSHAELVKAAIRDSKWSRRNSGIKIVPVVTAKEAFTAGDAMRDIYTHGIITSDFVLVYGDLVSNVRIDEVVRLHKERRKADKDAIMTIVVKESGAQHRSRSRGDSSVFVLDSETSECLHYEGVAGYPPKQLVRIPREILATHPQFEIRNDLIDCSIDVCSVEVPSLFQDNFDYGDIRRDFVHGILTSDLLEKKIHCHVVKDGYAARVRDTKSYDSVSKDILSRWTFPLVPGDHHPGECTYEHLRGNRYLARDNSVILSRTCKIGNNSMIGSSSHVHEDTQIISSVIGKNCSIGPGTVVRNSYLWDGTVVGAQCVIESSIIGCSVKIRERSRIERGCLVADGVVLGPDAYLEEYTRVSARNSARQEADTGSEDEDSELEEAESSHDFKIASLGAESNALVWPRGSPSGDDAVDEVENFQNRRLMRIGDDAFDLDLSDAGSLTSSEDESTSEEDDDFVRASSPASSSTSIPSMAPIHSLAEDTATSEFQSEVRQSLERAFAEGHSVDNAAVELKTLRMASNVPLRKVREAVIASIVDRIKIADAPAAQRSEIGGVIDRWGELITKIGGVDAVETIEILQIQCCSSERMPLFGQILAALYQSDIVEEDDIRQWHTSPASKGTGQKPASFAENMRKCWGVGARMIQQFDEQESSEEESD